MPTDTPQITFKPLTALRYDPENPRLPSNVNGKDQEAVLDWMLRDGTITELMGSIGEQGYFPGEPLLVTEAEDIPGTYFVVEGNRRLTAVKLLRNPELAQTSPKAVLAISEQANKRPETMPVLVYPSRRDILNYLSYRHVTGVKPWSSLQKAKYLQQLSRDYQQLSREDRNRQLAKIIGSRADYVSRLLTGVEVLQLIQEKRYFELRGVDEEAVSFSVLTTALSYKNIAEFVGLDESKEKPTADISLENLREVTAWVFEKLAEGRTRVGESRNLKLLSEVVASADALKAFRGGLPLTEASELTKHGAEVFRNSLIAAKNEMQSALQHVHSVNDMSEKDEESVQSIIGIGRTLRLAIQERMEEGGGVATEKRNA